MNNLNLRIQRSNNLNTIAIIDEKGNGNANHEYEVQRDDETLCKINFQNGARNEQGSIAGVTESDLLEIVRHRLMCFNSGEYRCRENACALTHIEEALMWLDKRTQDRAETKKLGYNEK